MAVGWAQMMFVPDEQAARDAQAAWRWRLPGPWRIVFSTMFGGLFIETPADGVVWLECPTGDIEPVADTAEALHAFLGGARTPAWEERIDEWFLPGLLEDLHAAGKVPSPGQCYGLTILPVFEGGLYDVANAFVLSAGEWLAATGAMHEQLSAVPDGAQVELKVT